ncbi:Hypothetical predicted protein, partial [Paramuricea clavata]
MCMNKGIHQVGCDETFRLRLKSDALPMLNKPLLDTRTSKRRIHTEKRQRIKGKVDTNNQETRDKMMQPVDPHEHHGHGHVDTAEPTCETSKTEVDVESICSFSSEEMTSRSHPLEATKADWNLRKFCDYLMLLNIPNVKRRQLSKILKNYVIPAVYKVWQVEQYARLREIENEPIIIASDMRVDSPGHSGLFGSGSTLEMKRNVILDSQVIKSTEVKNANAMELESLKRQLECLQDKVQVAKLVMDRHIQVSSYMTNEKPDIEHSYDICHVAKGSASYKKLDEMLTRPRLITAIRKLSQYHQTSGLEVKHSLDNQFASKNTYHSYHSLSAR